MNKNYMIMSFSVAVLSMLMLSSCSDWFDVSPKTDLEAGELFDTENGFQSALTGIYLTMATTNAYAGNMSFGLLDQLAQEYDYIPSGVQDISAIYNYETTTSDGYGIKQKIASSWQNLYNIIANCNNLVKWLDKKGKSVIGDSQEQQMLRGEALAIRAFCHFDLLRAWGPFDYRHNPEAPDIETIPYRTVADNSKQPRLKAKDVLDHVIGDLTQAKALMDFEQDTSLKNNERRFRFNYHAINALLARVYAYMGDGINAVACANEVIQKCGLELQTSNQNDPALFDECVCGLNMYELEDNLSSHWAAGDKFTTQYVISQQKFDKLFEVAGSRRDDFRSKSSAFYVYDTQNLNLSKKYSTNANELIPLIRLPEMYYILCEYTQDYTQSRNYINYVRNRRGYSASLNENYTTEEGKIQALDKEYRKEFYAEGQYWFFMKSHGLTEIPYALDVQLTEDNFVFPLPDAEIQYGWTVGN
ncbi:RagB/SusD family nutrient uptake outer membrane protein [Prevotella sp. KH2C16]|uniref:RagB/SusD family nutrient uptake outer membrane protein n=1 Tax=Prevotella sp. KH2C16 TaxID=1855325 RepID=UPI002101B9AE|nr:RagB/SusD family nutrient uptake outer membrane protein [Prevotella sp. KH2C16]